MFDEVTRRPDRGRGRRGAFVVLSAIVQGLAVLVVVVVGDRFRAAVTGTEPIVQVKFFKAAPAVPGPPPAPAPAPRRSRSTQARKERPRKPSPPTSLIQPRAPAPAPEPTPPIDPPEEPSGAEGGVGGGAPGGAAFAPPGEQRGAGDEPTFPKPGYRLPRLVVGTCVQSSLDLSKELQRTVSGPVVVKFAVLGDGRPAAFQVLSHVRDSRIGDAIWKAVAACRWVPGADASGQPVAIWVVVPFRFEQG